MLEVVYYQSSDELLSTVSGFTQPLVIAPSPVVADNLRARAPQLEVLTISKWVSDFLSQSQKKRIRKSELMLKLAAVWKHYFPEGNASQFNEAFELFTELRSFTLELELLAEFFKELDTETVRSLLIFWTFVEQEKLIDEQLAYREMATSTGDRALAFVGFKHLSGVQIDMLKQLGEDREVFLFFPENLLAETLPNDWIKWLDHSERTPRARTASHRLNVVVFPSGKANQITDFVDPGMDIILATTKATLLNYQEFQRTGQFFKTNEDLYQTERDILREMLLSLIQENQNADSVIAALENKKREMLKSAQYKMAKVMGLAQDSLISFSEVITGIDSFAVDIILEIVRLNSPRTSLVSIEKTITSRISDLNGLSFRAPIPSAVIASSLLGSFRGSEKILSEAMTRALKAIGPIKRAGLEFQFHRIELVNLLETENSVLYIEEELLESDLAWKEIFKGFDIELSALALENKKNERFDFIKSLIVKKPYHGKSFSASALQYYIDCPRKFYFHQIQKMNSKPEFQNLIPAEEMGNLEHKAISFYFAQKNFKEALDTEKCKNICRELIDNYCTEKRIALKNSELARAYNELLAFSMNGINFLIEFMNTYSAQEIKFEVALPDNDLKLKGFIDCLVELPDQKKAIFDFKRSSSAAGTKSETLNFQKIQLWVYLNATVQKGMNIHSFGYINLSDTEDDKLIFVGEEATKLLTEKLGPSRIRIEETISSIAKDSSFLAAPREPKVCHFCPVSLFCIREAI